MKKQLIISLCFFCSTLVFSQVYNNVTPGVFIQGFQLTSSVVGDVNGDGRIDIVVSGGNASKPGEPTETVIYLNENTGFRLVEGLESGIDKGVFWSKMNLGDYDKDGDLDLVMQGWCKDGGVTSQRSFVYSNNGKAKFTLVTELQPISNGAVKWGDYDNDGDLDVLQVGWVDNPAGGNVFIYKNEGSGVFTLIPNDIIGIADGSDWTDFNKDGNLDILVSGWNRTELFKGDGKGSFTMTTFSIEQNYEFSAVNCTDFNKDGKADILISGKVPNINPEVFTAQLLKGNGDFTFTPISTPDLVGVARGPIKFGHFENDSNLDLFVCGWGVKNGNAGGTFSVYKNDGSSNFQIINQASIDIAGWTDGSMEIADFNNDGYDEVFVCGWGRNELFVNNEAPTGIIISKQDDDLKVYVSNKQLSIKTSKNLNNAKLNIFDISGRNVFSGINNISNKINLSKLQKGVFLVKLDINGIQYLKGIVL